MSQEPLYAEIYRKNATPQNLGPHFARACAVEMHFGVSQGPLQNADTHFVRACSQNACQHFTRATLYGNLQAKRHAPESAQNADTHFLQACAVEMHVNISQEPLFAEIYRKNAVPQNLGPHFVRACAAEMHVNISREPLHEKFTGKMPRLRVSPERGHTLCASLRLRHACQFHKSHFLRKFTGKMPRARVSPERGHTLCASLRLRHACQHFTRAAFAEIYRKNAGAQGEHPDQAPAFTPTVRTPQCGHTVWGTKRKPRLTLRNQKPGNQETTTPGN